MSLEPHFVCINRRRRALPFQISRLALVVALLFGILPALSASDLSGKRVAILGDSMTWIGGDSCQNEKGWTWHFKRAAKPKSIDIYARSGATWTNTATTRTAPEAYTEVLDDNNVIFNQVVRLIAAADKDAARTPDVIVIAAGGNDAWFHAKRPGCFDVNKPVPDIAAQNDPAAFTTLKSSVTLACTMLSNRFPKARIVLVTPAEMTKTSVENINKVGDIIEQTGAELGLKTLRADKHVDIKRSVELKNHVNTYDGVHTNPSGAKLLADYIGSHL